MPTVDLQGPLGRRAQVEAFQRKHRIGLLTLVFTDIIGSTKLKQRLGDAEGFDRIQEHHEALRETLRRFPEGEEISTAGDSFFIVFAKPSEAVKFALALQSRLRGMAQASGAAVFDRVGIHIGEVIIDERTGGPKPKDLYGIQVDICARVMSSGEGDQVLMTRSTFDNARQVLKGKDVEGLGDLVWLNHGAYTLQGVEEPLEICEVGEEGLARLRPPADSEKVRRFVSAADMARREAERDAKAPGGGAAKWGWIAAVAVVVIAGMLAVPLLRPKDRGNQTAAATSPAAASAPVAALVERIGFEADEGYVTGQPLYGQRGWTKGTWPGQMESGGQGVAKGLFGTAGSAEGQQAFIGGVTGATEPNVHASLTRRLAWAPGFTDAGVIEIAWTQSLVPSAHGAEDWFTWLFYNQGGQFLLGLVFDNESKRVGRRFADNSYVATPIAIRNGERVDVKIRIDFRRNNWSATVGRETLPPMPLALDGRQGNLGSMAVTWRSHPTQSRQAGAAFSGDNVMAFDDFVVTAPRQ